MIGDIWKSKSLETGAFASIKSQSLSTSEVSAMVFMTGEAQCPKEPLAFIVRFDSFSWGPLATFPVEWPLDQTS